MKRLLLLFILISFSFAPAFSQAKAPTNQELENKLYKQGVQLDYLIKTLADTETELKEVKDDGYIWFSEYKADTDKHIAFYTWFITLIIGAIGIVAPILINRSYQKSIETKMGKLKEEVAEVNKIQAIVNEAKTEIEKIKTTVQGQSDHIKQMQKNMAASAVKTKIDSDIAVKSANEAKAYSLFFAALKEENTARKIELYTEAIKLKPDFADAYNNRGNSHHKQGDYDNAIDDYNKAIELKPDNATAYNNLAWLYANLKSADSKLLNEALLLANKAVTLDVNDINSYDTRKVIYEKLAGLATDKTEIDKYKDSANEDKAMVEKLTKQASK